MTDWPNHEDFCKFSVKEEQVNQEQAMKRRLSKTEPGRRMVSCTSESTADEWRQTWESGSYRKGDPGTWESGEQLVAKVLEETATRNRLRSVSPGKAEKVIKAALNLAKSPPPNMEAAEESRKTWVPRKSGIVLSEFIGPEVDEPDLAEVADGGARAGPETGARSKDSYHPAADRRSNRGAFGDLFKKGKQ